MHVCVSAPTPTAFSRKRARTDDGGDDCADMPVRNLGPDFEMAASDNDDNPKSLMLKHVMNFYAKSPEAYDALSDILLRKEGGVSLRTLDWLCNSYSKTHGIEIPRAAGTGRFRIHEEYLGMLGGFGKSYFDMFARGQRLRLTMHGRELVTTPAQLKFFWWSFESGVYSYAKEHEAEIRESLKEESKVRTAELRRAKAEKAQAALRDLPPPNFTLSFPRV